MKKSIPLGIYGNKALDILTAMRLKYFKHAGRTANNTWNSDICNFEQAPDGEISLVINENVWYFRRSSWHSKYTPQARKNFLISRIGKHLNLEIANAARLGKENRIFSINSAFTNFPTELALTWESEADARAYLNKTKCDVGIKMNYYIDFSKENNCTINKLDVVTFGEIKFLLDALIGRKRSGRNVSDEMTKAIIGQKRDPLATEMETVRREEIIRLKEELKNKKNSLSGLKYKERKEMEEALNQKYNKMYDDLDNEYAEKINALTCMAFAG